MDTDTLNLVRVPIALLLAAALAAPFPADAGGRGKGKYKKKKGHKGPAWVHVARPGERDLARRIERARRTGTPLVVTLPRQVPRLRAAPLAALPAPTRAPLPRTEGPVAPQSTNTSSSRATSRYARPSAGSSTDSRRREAVARYMAQLPAY